MTVGVHLGDKGRLGGWGRTQAGVRQVQEQHVSPVHIPRCLRGGQSSYGITHSSHEHPATLGVGLQLSTFPGPVGWGQKSLCPVADADSEPDRAPGDLPQSLHPTWLALSAGGAPHGRAEPQRRGVPGEGLQTPGPWDAGPRAQSAAEMTVKVKSFYLFQERTRKVDLDILYENRQTEKRTK